MEKMIKEIVEDKFYEMNEGWRIYFERVYKMQSKNNQR